MSSFPRELGGFEAVGTGWSGRIVWIGVGGAAVVAAILLAALLLILIARPVVDLTL